MWTAFPSADYYGRSVTLGLAARRRSRVSSSRTVEHDTSPLNGLTDIVAVTSWTAELRKGLLGSSDLEIVAVNSFDIVTNLVIYL
jgi:hypothetical protein